MAKINRKKQRIVAWRFGIRVFLIIIALIGVAFFVLKDPVSNKISELTQETKEEELETVAEEEPVTEEINTEEEAISEEALNQIFEDLDEEPIEEEPESVSEDSASDELAAMSQEILDSMNLEDMVAQLFFVTPEALTGVDVATAAGEKTKEAITSHPVGGIILFAQNVDTPDQLTQMTSNIQKYSEERVSLPMLIGIDEEGGRVARIASNENFEVEKIGPMKEIGDAGDYEKAYEAGHTIGTYLKENGINVDFAPDCDVLMDDSTSAIGDRSFGSDPQLVADMSSNYLKGLSEAGVIGSAKHFPGHGAATSDTHEGAAVVDKTWDEMSESDIVPFKQLVFDGVPMVMVSHISVPEVTGDDIPASLSGILITEKLRAELGFTGVVITDSMKMGAISDNYSSKEAAIEALKAGVDMVLMPQDFEEAYNGVLSAVEDGTLTEERIKESVLRIIKLKLSLQKSEEAEE